VIHYVFFFQAEDDIRDRNVTGVQTCALPIFKEIPIDLIEVVEEESASTRSSFGGQKEKYNRPITNEFNTKKQPKQRAMRPQTTGAETKSWQTGDKANHKVWGI